jgi:hypothetical protein
MLSKLDKGYHVKISMYHAWEQCLSHAVVSPCTVAGRAATRSGSRSTPLEALLGSASFFIYSYSWQGWPVGWGVVDGGFGRDHGSQGSDPDDGGSTGLAVSGDLASCRFREARPLVKIEPDFGHGG